MTSNTDYQKKDGPDMARGKVPTMAADDSRQYMLNENFEIYEKFGVPSGATEMHFHNFNEILYIIEGQYTVLLNNTTYHLKQGDCLLIGQNQLHHYQHEPKQHDACRRILMWVSDSYLEQLSSPDTKLSHCLSYPYPAWHLPTPDRKRLEQYLTNLLYLEADSLMPRGEARLLKNAYITLFFICLNQICRHSELALTTENTCIHPMIRALTDFINEHISEPITLDMLAKQAGSSKYHFVRSFKKLTGMTVHDFVTHKRIIKACEMIWDGQPLGDIYQFCGFSDYSSFFRNFKSIYGISPSDFKAFYEKEPLS